MRTIHESQHYIVQVYGNDNYLVQDLKAKASACEDWLFPFEGLAGVDFRLFVLEHDLFTQDEKIARYLKRQTGQLHVEE